MGRRTVGRRRLLVVLGATAMLLAVVVAASLLAWGPETAFNDQDWHVWPNVLSPGRWGNNSRARMVGDLLPRLKVGTPADEVSAILGEPDCGAEGHRFYELLCLPRPDQELVAWLKWRTTDPMLLVKVAPDTEGKWRVVKAEIVRHF